VQTIKTAAIVVLVMTVIYGVWVPLTTPPEELPPEVADMLVVTDDFGIDTGLPESLESIANFEADPSGPAVASTETIASSSTYAMPGSDGAADGPQPAANQGQSYGASFADLPSSAAKPARDAMGLPASEPMAATGNMPQKLPEALNDSPAITGITAGNYPSTGSQFRTPDPDASMTSFSPSAGKRFQAPDAESLTDETPTISLSSGTTATEHLTPPRSSGDVATLGEDLSKHDSENLGLKNAILTADRQYTSDQKKEALATLSLFYNTPNVSAEQRSQLLIRLDPLAREVIYSQSHLLEQPHRVTSSETLMDVAERYEVPWQLLANINEIRDPVTVLPGTELKVLRGPFNVQVDLDRKELTLFLGDLYAGRFPIGVGQDPEPRPGTFTVQDKQTSRTFYDASGTPIPAGSPDNPYGNMWVDLGGRLCIHGSPNTMQPTDQGCISLADDQAGDLYGILTQGSLVTIRR